MSDTLGPLVPAQIGLHGAGGHIPREVHLMAYEVYCEVFRPQQALIEGNARGGFGVGELICFLYARNFPQKEWRARFDGALKGVKAR